MNQILTTTKRLPVTIAALRRASSRTLVLRLRIADGQAFAYRPGQFVGLEAADGRPRFFSIANAQPVDNALELHVNRVQDGLFTTALFETAQVGDVLWMEGPYGDFSIPPQPKGGVILVAGGTGFAPIKACLEEMAARHPDERQAASPIHLYWGARSAEDLYDLASLRALSRRLPGLRVVPVLDQGDPAGEARSGRVHRAVIEDFADLSDYDIYACGAPPMIEALSDDCAAERGFDPARLTADLFVVGSDAVAAPVGAGGITLILNEPDGPRTIEGAPGEALLFALRRAGAALQSVCGGQGACGTCRVHIAPPWRARIPEPAKREARLLAHTGAGEGDRLSCRILLTADLAGLELQTCADSKGDAQ